MRWSWLAVLLIAGCQAIPSAGGPADTVRQAFQRMAAQDLVGASTLVCPAQRDPSALPIAVGGIFEPTGPVPAGSSVAETLALYELDVSGIRVDDVRTDEDTVLVPVSGVLRERLDNDEVEAAVRRTAAAQAEAVDEPALRAVLERIKAGPFELDLDQNVEAVQVTKIGNGWFICEPLPSPAPSAALLNE
jgi:hypothetical protein